MTETQMPAGPGMAGMLSKMPGPMRKMMMGRKINAMMGMDAATRKKNVAQMLGQVAQLDNSGEKAMIETRLKIGQEMKKNDPAKAEKLAKAFQAGFSSLPKDVQDKMRVKLSQVCGKKLTAGKEWEQFDSVEA